MDITKKKAEESVAMIEEEKNKNETAHFQAMENVQKELNKIDIELKKTLEENDKTKQDHIEKMQEIEFKLAEKEQENKRLRDIIAELTSTVKSKVVSKLKENGSLMYGIPSSTLDVFEAGTNPFNEEKGEEID